ncbi:MAG: hypothetical protein DHS20C08_21060 [Rhodomicrobium sp.]|nr:MAG: hypothetical protein DHS20C08_21060 [Rhodomicrobium sp.]
MSGDGKTGFFGRWLGGTKQDDVKAKGDKPAENEPPEDVTGASVGEESAAIVHADASVEEATDAAVAETEVTETEVTEIEKDDVSVRDVSAKDDLAEDTVSPEIAPALATDNVVEEVAETKKSWFSRLKSGLSKSSTKLADGISGIFTKRKLDDEAIEELEDLLIQSDLGVAMAMRITERLAATRYDKEISDEEVKAVLAEEVEAILSPVAQPLVLSGAHKPEILLMVGVNGAGKTTTIGKYAQKFRAEGKSVMMAAGDTFRAAAIDQLKVWGERTGAQVIARDVGADASGLVYDALTAAKEAGSDVLMIDTAGRLQNKANLMAELEKIVRVIKKIDDQAPHHVLLTLDATTGQNAMNQVDIFQKVAGVTGLVMTKLDGSARGGILVAIADKYKLPIHAVGVGEGIDDMQAFDPKDFAGAIANISPETAG